MDTLPDVRSIRDSMQLIEAETLSLAVDKIEEAKRDGRMITHSIASTTKRGVGQFATQGLCIGCDNPFPLPLLPICGESTEDVADQVALAIDVLGAVKGIPPAEVYQLVDTHMTDSVSHNKGVNTVLVEVYNRDTEAGQLFCGVHTTLGLSGDMDKKE